MSGISTAQENCSLPLFAALESVSYASLVRATPETLNTLWRAVVDQGFFYMMLDDPLSEELSHDAHALFETSRDLFRLPMEEKMQFDTKILGRERNYGYKPVGRNFGVNGSEKDGHELYLIPRDALFESSVKAPTFACPTPLYRQKDVIQSFTIRAHQVCNVILDALSRCLDPKGGQMDLTALHRFDEASTTAIGLLRYPLCKPGTPEAGHIAHTDVGSLTLLFATHGGLQVEDPKGAGSSGRGCGRWLDVERRPGAVVVNVGDALRFLSDRTLRSCLHRVVPHTTGSEDRYSIAYFLRPSTQTVFRDAEGCTRTSLEWHNRKFETFQSRSAGLAGGISEGILNAVK